MRKSLRLHRWRSFSTLVLPLLTQNSGFETEVVLILTGRLKRCNYGPICSPNAFNSDFDNSTWLKRCLTWNSPQSSRAKWSLEAEIIPLLSVCYETRTVHSPFYLCFLLVMVTQKYILGRKNRDRRSWGRKQVGDPIFLLQFLNVLYMADFCAKFEKNLYGTSFSRELL